MFLLIAYFTVDPAESADQALADAAEPVRLLAAQPDTRTLRWGRSTEDAGRLVLVAEFETAAAYRRAQSPFDVRTVLIPWLSRAEVRTSGVFEVLAAADGGEYWEPDVTVPDPVAERRRPRLSIAVPRTGGQAEPDPGSSEWQTLANSTNAGAASFFSRVIAHEIGHAADFEAYTAARRKRDALAETTRRRETKCPTGRSQRQRAGRTRIGGEGDGRPGEDQDAE